MTLDMGYDNNNNTPPYYILNYFLIILLWDFVKLCKEKVLVCQRPRSFKFSLYGRGGKTQL